MSANKMLDAVQEWLKGLRAGATSSQPKEGMYNGKKVFIYSETHSYIIISYTNDGKKLFSINPTELE